MKGLTGVKQDWFASVAGLCSSRITQRDSFDGANAEPQRITEQQDPNCLPCLIVTT